MPKWIGNYVGIARSFASNVNGGEADSGIYSMFDRDYGRKIAGWGGIDSSGGTKTTSGDQTIHTFNSCL